MSKNKIKISLDCPFNLIFRDLMGLPLSCLPQVIRNFGIPCLDFSFRSSFQVFFGMVQPVTARFLANFSTYCPSESTDFSHNGTKLLPTVQSFIGPWCFPWHWQIPRVARPPRSRLMSPSLKEIIMVYAVHAFKYFERVFAHRVFQKQNSSTTSRPKGHLPERV